VARQAGTTRPLIYAAIGASESVGVGADDPATQSWVAVLATRLPVGSHLHNFGVSGITLAGALRQELPGALAARPDLITVWNVVNDINARVPLDTYRTQLNTLLGTLRKRTHAIVFVGNVPALDLAPAYIAHPKTLAAVRAAIPRWNAAIRQLAARHGAVVVDLYTPSLALPQHPDYVSADGFHPSTAGYHNVADTFWRAIKPRLGHIPRQP